MLRTRLTALTLLLGTAAFGTACSDRQAANDATPATQEQAQPPANGGAEELATGAFDEPEGAQADVGGSYQLRGDGAGATTLDVQLEGLPPGEHSWHIHRLGCDTEGPIAIALSPSPGDGTAPGASVLVAGADGRASASVTIPPAELQKLGAGAAADSTPATVVTPPNSEAPVNAPIRGMAGGGDRKLSIHVHQGTGASAGPTVACAELDASKLQAGARPAGER